MLVVDIYDFFLLVVFLGLCILVIGGVTFEYICDIIVEWVRLYFGFVC